MATYSPDKLLPDTRTGQVLPSSHKGCRLDRSKPLSPKVANQVEQGGGWVLRTPLALTVKCLLYLGSLVASADTAVFLSVTALSFSSLLCY